MSKPALQLWTGVTFHKRFSPFERRFRYRIFLIDVDIDRLSEADRFTPLFGVDRPALFSFASTDHGPCTHEIPLRTWAETFFSDAGIQLNRGRIRLVTFPRHLFYKFAPLSIWYGYGPDDDLRGVIYEVRNTFGERHCYVAAAGCRPARHTAEKAFHVSPFFDVTGQYRFTLRSPDNKLSLTIENFVDGERIHMASIAAERRTAGSANLLQAALLRPLSSIGVIVAIHWEALKIWMRGARYRQKPAPPQLPVTLAYNTAETNVDKEEKT